MVRTPAEQAPGLVRAARVLVVDDDPEVRAAVADALTVEGHEVETAEDGLTALSAVARWDPDALVLDVLMPALDGLAVCRRMRALGDRTPVLVLTALDAVSDRVDGLDAGADDYLVKPFALDELTARVRALLRRVAPDPADEEGLVLGELELDPVTRTGRRGERSIEFTETECALLQLLMRHPAQTVPRQVLLEEVWGRDFGPDSNSLAVYIGYLRRKLEAGGEPRLVQTVHGVGYRLDRS
ncbi:response regulator transcription factor [Streptomyces tubbatahanensis]|uniref:Response regulator transcription factor n=1 Tax=Streptomyces tubbatahanensis TaxID=2923272 RepID=A0ABY3XX35_9ACTN|nr:response regulator transcription factor [Streptomyces tubbatahanensis]UNS99045.1 response regulator transcription factor [Streptomyces tubbatahanensis]